MQRIVGENLQLVKQMNRIKSSIDNSKLKAHQVSAENYKRIRSNFAVGGISKDPLVLERNKSLKKMKRVPSLLHRDRHKDSTSMLQISKTNSLEELPSLSGYEARDLLDRSEALQGMENSLINEDILTSLIIDRGARGHSERKEKGGYMQGAKISF